MLLEVCVDTIEGAYAAKCGGAGRIELCAALSEGGLTPSAGLMAAVARLGIPVFAMIRPRSGFFHFSSDEEAIMLTDIDTAREAGLAGVVLGAQDAGGALDLPMLERLSNRADGIGRTLHRVTDVVREPLKALDQAIELGFDRVLTSGAAPLAPDGTQLIAEMMHYAAGRITVMPGCGLSAANVGTVVSATGAREVHAACNRPIPGNPAFSDFDPKGGRWETSEDDVRAMVTALNAS